MKNKLNKSFKILLISMFSLIYFSFGTASYSEFIPYVNPQGEEVVIPNKEDTTLEDKLKQIKIDYDKVKEINDETVGWLYMEGITYSPVMDSGDNEKYLRQDYNGNYSIEGELFLSENSKGVFDDMSLIYGHNMASGAKFGRLKTFKSKEAFENQGPLILFDGNDFKIYEAFASFFHIDGTTLFERKGLIGEERDKYIKEEIYSRSRHIVDGIEDIDFNNDILFLQTCFTSVGLEREVAALIQTQVINVSELT